MRLQVAGASLHAQVSGEGDPVLMLHGYPLSGALWDGIVPDLAREFRLIVPDLRGFGGSSASGAASMARYADDAVAVVDHLGERRPLVVVGHSMGGYVAFELARRHASRVRALVLVCSRAAPDDAAQARARHESAERILREGSMVAAEAMAAKLFAATSSPELRDAWRASMAANPPEGLAAALLAMANRPDSLPTLRQFAHEVLVVAGEDDAIVPVEDARAMNEAARLSRLALVTDAGHMVPVEQPERLAELLRGFLHELEPLHGGTPIT